MRQNQVLSTGSTDLALPELMFSQSTKTPFKRQGSSRDPRWYERLQYSLNSRLTNRFNFTPLSEAELIARGDTLADGSPVDYDWWEAVFDQEKYEAMTGRTDQRLDFRATHRVPIAAPVTINRIPLLGAGAHEPVPQHQLHGGLVSGDRAPDRRLAGVHPAGERVRLLRPSPVQHGRVPPIRTVYGLFPVRLGEYQGLRHTLRPRLGFSWRPDFSSPTWGYARTLLDEDGMPVEQELVSGEFEERRYSIVPGLQTGQSRALSFGIDNTFETKRVRVDSTGNEDSRVMKLFNVNVSSNYNMAADSLKLAPIRISARTNVLGKLRLNISGTLSPYRLNSTGTRDRQPVPVEFSGFQVCPPHAAQHQRQLSATRRAPPGAHKRGGRAAGADGDAHV